MARLIWRVADTGRNVDEALLRTLAILAALALTTQTVRHAYLLVRASILGSGQIRPALKNEIEAADRSTD